MRLRTAVLSRQGRLFCCLISVMLVASLAHAVPVCTVSDIVYRGDGTPAQGTLVISWPAFTSAENKAVAAGSMSVAIGAGGAVTLALVPNEGGDPANTYYKVVYKLNDGSTSIEYWSVPNVIATTISAIRSKIVPANVAMQVASRQYVDTAIAGNIGNAVKIHGRDIDPAAPTGSGDKLVWDAASARFKNQSSPWIDVRDYGADCNFNAASDTALANALAAATNGREIIIPGGCNLKLTQTFLIHDKSSIRIRGLSGMGSDGSPISGAPTLSWCGPAGGTVVSIDRGHGIVLEAISVSGRGLGCGNSAGVGIKIDKTIAGSLNTTDILLDRINVNGDPHGQGPAASFIGVDISPVSTSNVEDVRLLNSTVYALGSGGIGVRIGASNNAKNEVIHHSNIVVGLYGVQVKGGSVKISENEFSTTPGLPASVIRIEGGGTEPIYITGNLAENFRQFVDFNNNLQGSASPLIIEGNKFDMSSASPALCFVELGQDTIGSLVNNKFDNNSHPKPFCGGDGSYWWIGPNLYGSGSSPTSYLDLAAGGTTNSVKTLRGGLFSANSHLYAGSRQFAGVGADAGFGFFNSAAQLRRGIGINQNLDSSTSNSLGVLPVGRDNLFLGDGEIEFGSLGQPNGLTCTVTGSGASTWLFRVVAKDAGGRRSLGSYAVSCFSAAATLNATNYVTISHPGVPGAVSYDYVARDPGSNSQFKLMLNSTATSANIQSTPVAPWDYVIPKYNETANIKLRAYDTAWWLGGFLRGYSDSGTTQKWSIDSVTGNAAFNQVSIAGAALTSVHGNSGKVATVSGTTSNGNIAKFDASGNLIDGGVGGGGGDDLSNASESLLFTTDNTYDIGASAANRPQHIYVASALRPANGSSTAPSYSFSGATGVGFYYNSGVGGPTTNTALGVGGNLSIANAALAWNSGDNFSGSWDLWLRRDAANILAQRNGTSAQVFRLYNTFTDSSNYERLNISWSSNAAHINTGAAGTGSPRSLFFGVGAAEWRIDSSGTLSAATDNTVDVGASGANRPRRGYFGTEVVTPKLSGITDANVVANLNADMVDGKHAGDFAKLLDYQKTAADITGDGTDKDLYSFSIPAGAMATGKGVRIKVWWRCSTCTSASKTFKWTYGASSLSYSSTTSTATAVSYTSVTIMNDPGATNAQQMMSEVLTLGSTAAAAPAGFGTASEDSTAAVTVKFQFNAPSSETFTPRAWLVEKLD